MIPVLLGSMILTPYIVGTVVLRIFRKAEAARAMEDEATRSTANAPPTTSRSHADPTGTAPVRA
jgi:hypothetical protein